MISVSTAFKPQTFPCLPPIRTVALLFSVCLLSIGLLPGLNGQETGPVQENTPAADEPPSDSEILERLPGFSTNYVRDLLSVYARLRNEKMVNALTEELRRREPNSAAAAAITAESIMDDSKPPNPNDALEDRIDLLMKTRKTSEAIAFMEKLKGEKFKGKSFPFELELGHAYATAGNLDSAGEAYRNVVESKTFSPDRKAKARHGLTEIEKMGELKIAYALIKQRKNDEALSKAELLKGRYPNDPEVQVLYAQALVSNNLHAEALPMLEHYKAKYYRGQSYPAQDALAEALLATGRLDESKAAYDELAIDPNALPHIREEAIRESLRISKMRKRRVSGDFEWLSEDEGDAALIHAETMTPIGEDTLAGVRGLYYDVSLSKDRSIRSASGDFFGGIAFARKYFDNRMNYVEGQVGGGSHDKLIWGASFGRERTHYGTYGYEISVAGNEPAIDSLQLIALNGNQDRVVIQGSSPLPGLFEISGDVWARRVSSQGVDLGDGYGGFLEISRPIWFNAAETAQVNLAYRADYERFRSNRLRSSEVRRLDYNGTPEDGRDLGADLLEPLYHPHGFYLTYERQLNQRAYFYTRGGLAYDFADEEWDYQLTAGLEWGLTDELDLMAEAGYYSGGTGATNNDSAVLLGLVGLRMYY